MPIDSTTTLSPPIRLSLRMTLSWALIDEVRHFVGAFCAWACPSLDRGEHLSLAVHELLQNAVVCTGEEAVELSLEIDPTVNHVSIRVTNTCTAPQAVALRERLEEMRREPDALRHYLATMAQTSAAERGGLGLARIRFEAQLGLEALFELGRVTVTASGTLVPPLPSESRLCHG